MNVRHPTYNIDLVSEWLNRLRLFSTGQNGSKTIDFIHLWVADHYAPNIWSIYFTV